MTRTRFVLAPALVAAMAAIATAPLSPAGAAPDPLAWVGDNPFVSLVYAQSGQGQEPAEPEPVQEPEPAAPPVEEAQEPAEPAEEEPAVQSVPEPVQMPAPEPEPAAPVEEAQEPAEPAEEPEAATEPEPEAEQLDLGDVYSALIAAETAQEANQVSVDASTETLDEARQTLIEAEEAHAAAMEDQGERNADVRGAAQQLIDYLTATYLVQ